MTYTKKIMLLGSGELGKEFVIAVKRLGHKVVAVDSYAPAPAMQVADEHEVISMLDGNELDRVVAKHKPDIIVPEIEAIRTERLFEYEKQGILVIPSARATNYTMNRKAIRELAAKELGLKTAHYRFAKTAEEFKAAVKEIGIPCVVKPIMSSSGKGQSVVKSEKDIEKAWEYGTTKGRGDAKEVIVEEFINFHTEITLLTVTQRNGKTLFCPALGHRQERGDYMESWMPVTISEKQLKEAQQMADKVTKALTGAGIWGVEFFLTEDSVYFSELSPRPHDTGMVTLAGTTNFSEFELHARAVLGIPIPEITLERAGASAVILANDDNKNWPDYSDVEKAASQEKCDVRIFGKPVTRVHRRMGVVVVWDKLGTPEKQLREKAKKIADMVRVN
jgi:phosphoribosylglycinamide formyltransferase 2